MNNHQKALFQAMERAAFYPSGVKSVQRIDTHISVVYLTGKYAYKLKKAKDLGFLNFTRLQDRKFYCEEELRINRRTAPQLYLDVLPVYAVDGQFSLQPADNQKSEVIEFAVKMRQFDTALQLDALLSHDAITAELLDELAAHIVSLHRRAAVADCNDDYGAAERLLAPCVENFEQLQETLETALVDSDISLDVLKTWTMDHWKALKPVFSNRKKAGYIRECHGDMHLANIAIIDGAVTLYDGIEFDPYLRWIDVASDLAFLLMDLQSHGYPHYATQVLNAYLRLTGDYELMQVLRFYQVYRAMVRAKVAALQQQLEQCRHYLELAQSYIRQIRPVLYITLGLSGSGKTWGSTRLARRYDLLHVRSDVERKRLSGLEETDRVNSAFKQGLYTSAMTTKTYQRLEEISRQCLLSGYSLIVDATFLDEKLRDEFRELAGSCQANFRVLYFTADQAQLEKNILHRLQQNKDASDATVEVLHQQLKSFVVPQRNEELIEIAFGQALPELGISGEPSA